MPDPDPQPPKPRAVSPARWLLLLLPSVPMLIAPLIEDAQVHLRNQVDSEDRIGTVIVVFLLALSVSAVLSVIMGLLLEKWRYGAIKDNSRAIFCGFLILLVNCFISFTGCSVGSAIYK